MSGCHHVAYSPPSRINMMETAETPNEGRQRVGAGIGAHAGVFAFSVTTASARYSKGLTDEVALSGEAGVMRADEGVQFDEIHPYIYIGHVAAKVSPRAAGGHVAFEFGAGGGWSTAGQFASPDVGIYLSYDFGVLEPFLHGYGFLSVPFNTSPITYDYAEVAGSSTNQHTIEAQTTLGAGGYGGLAIHLNPRHRMAPQGTQHDLLAGLGYTGLARIDGERVGLITFGAGYQVEF
jgi:hypothetical protein